MADTEPRSVTLVDEEEKEGPEMTHEEMKEEEQAVIQRQIEATNAQLDTLEQMEKNGNPLDGVSMTAEELANAGIHVTNIMEFSATIELSAPKDISKMYNFSGVKSNLPRDDINLQFCRGVLKDRKIMLEDMKHNSIRRKSLLDPQTILLLKSQEESNLFKAWNSDKISDGKYKKIDEMSKFWSNVSDEVEFRKVDRKPEGMFGQSVLTVKKNYLNRINHGQENGQFKIKAAYTNRTKDVANAYMERTGKRKQNSKTSCLLRQTDKVVGCKSFWEGISDNIYTTKESISTILSEQIGTETFPQTKKKWESLSNLTPETIDNESIQDREKRVNEKKNFWRKAAVNNQKEQKPQSERNPEWLAEYQKNKLGTQQKHSNDFWKKVEIKTAEKEATPELQKGTINAEKKKSKEEGWEVSLSDDTWYRAPQFHPEGTQSRRTDIEVLCEIIYAHGERYDDGTAAIGFTWLFKMFNRANIVGILIKAKKHGLVFFDGEIVFASVRAEDDDEFVVLQKPIGEIRRAFNDMRGRHADMFEFDGKRRATIVLPNQDCDESEELEDSEEESD